MVQGKKKCTPCMKWRRRWNMCRLRTLVGAHWPKHSCYQQGTTCKDPRRNSSLSKSSGKKRPFLNENAARVLPSMHVGMHTWMAEMRKRYQRCTLRLQMRQRCNLVLRRMRCNKWSLLLHRSQKSKLLAELKWCCRKSQQDTECRRRLPSIHTFKNKNDIKNKIWYAIIDTEVELTGQVNTTLALW